MYLQLVELLDINKINDEYLKKIYYFCCFIGGGESIDYYMHKLVYKISKSIKIELNLYHYKNFSFIDLLKNTEQYKDLYPKHIITKFNNFIDKIKDNDINNNYNDYEYFTKNINIFESSLSIRGFNQRINFNKVYQGNICQYGRVNNYFINFKDIEILLKIKDIYKEKYEDAIQTYLQIYQMYHTLNLYYYNHTSLFIERNICSDSKDIYNINCIKRSHELKSNITTCLENYGDCREINLIKLIYIEIDNFNNFLIYFNNNNFNEMEKMIINHFRLISLDIYMNGRFKKPLRYVNKYLFTGDELKDDDELNKYELNYLKIINNNKMIRVENHVIVIEMNKEIILHDLLYKEKNLKFNMDIIYDSIYSADYYFDKVIGKNKQDYLELGNNYFNEKIFQYGIISYLPFGQFKIMKNSDYEYVYVSNPYKLNKFFYNVNKYILWRENKMYYNRIKYFDFKYKVFRYIYPINSYKNSYFLLEDL